MRRGAIWALAIVTLWLGLVLFSSVADRDAPPLLGTKPPSSPSTFSSMPQMTMFPDSAKEKDSFTVEAVSSTDKPTVTPLDVLEGATFASSGHDADDDVHLETLKDGKPAVMEEEDEGIDLNAVAEEQPLPPNQAGSLGDGDTATAQHVKEDFTMYKKEMELTIREVDEHGGVDAIAGQDPSDHLQQHLHPGYEGGRFGWVPDAEEECIQPLHPNVKSYCRRVGVRYDPTCIFTCVSQRRGWWKKPLDAAWVDHHLLSLHRKEAISPEHGVDNSTCDLKLISRRLLRTRGKGTLSSSPIRFERGLLQQIASCPVSQMSRIDALALLRHFAQGKPILFAGDSMMRHVFSRLVLLLRGYTTIADRPYQCDAVYSIGTKGDVFLRKHDSVDFKPFEVDIGERLLTLVFIWDRYMHRPTHVRAVSQYQPRLLVVGWFYWWDFKDPRAVFPHLRWLDRWLGIQALLSPPPINPALGSKKGPLDMKAATEAWKRKQAGASLLTTVRTATTDDKAGTSQRRQPVSSNYNITELEEFSRRRVIFFTSPPMRYPSNRLVNQQIHIRNELISRWAWGADGRTRRERRVTLEGKPISKQGSPRVLLVDFEALAREQNFPMVDRIHYQCSFQTLCLKKGTFDDKHPLGAKNKPCDDPLLQSGQGEVVVTGTRHDGAGCADFMNKAVVDLTLKELSLLVD